MGVMTLLKEGLDEKDWDKVKRAYNELAGIEPEDLILQSVHAKNNLYDNIGEDEEDEQSNFVHQIRKPNSKPKRGKIIVSDDLTGEEKNYGVTEPINRHKVKTVGNLFNPDEYNDVEKDADIGIVYPKKSKKGKRPPPKFIKTNCERCKKSFTVAPFFIKSTGYVCDGCIGRMRSE